MYRGLKIAVIAPCYNEEAKISSVVTRVRALPIIDEMIVVDDGSSDKSVEVAKGLGATVIPLPSVQGVGAALRTGFEYARTRCDVIVVIAGNNKDEPQQIPRLLNPIVDGKAVFVQGSRFLDGGGYGGDMPFYRKIATRVHPVFFSFVTGKKVTESTNGFRAFRVSLLDDPKIVLNQSWLDQYELEPYLYYKAITLGHPTAEVPVTKIYPPRKIGNTKMKPITGWWSILRPLILLRMGVRK